MTERPAGIRRGEIDGTGKYPPLLDYLRPVSAPTLGAPGHENSSPGQRSKRMGPDPMDFRRQAQYPTPDGDRVLRSPALQPALPLTFDTG